MKLYYHSGDVPNFGDDLNSWLWPRLLPEVIADGDERQLLVAIGSMLTNALPQAAAKFVFGSGYGGHRAKPAIDESWYFYFVRGPRTARVLGLPEALAITDSAILVRAVNDALQPAPKRYPVSLMPHWEAAQFGAWREVAGRAGVHLIDPRNSVEQTLGELRATELLITEDMHGAVVADALRVPWIPVRPTGRAHRFTWVDWCESLTLEFEPYSLGASTVNEFVRLKGGSQLYPKNLVRQTTGRGEGGLDSFMIAAAARRLKELARKRPMLSAKSQCNMRTEQALTKLEQLRADFRRGHFDQLRRSVSVVRSRIPLGMPEAAE